MQKRLTKNNLFNETLNISRAVRILQTIRIMLPITLTLNRQTMIITGVIDK